MVSQALDKGWLVQVTTTDDLLATVIIYAFRQMMIGPLPRLHDTQILRPTVHDRVKANLVRRLKKADEQERAEIENRITSTFSASIYVFTNKAELKNHLLAILELFGETRSMARRRASEWIAASNHDLLQS